MKDKQNNIKIDKKKLTKKKKIMIPNIQEDREKYEKMIIRNKRRLLELKKNSPGYIRFFEFKDHYPKAKLYEPDQKDVNFVKNKFP